MEDLKALQTNTRINLLCSHIFMVTGKTTSFGISSDAVSNLPLSAMSPETGWRSLCHGDEVLLMQASDRCDGHYLCGARGPRGGREAAGRGSGGSSKKKNLPLRRPREVSINDSKPQFLHQKIQVRIPTQQYPYKN